MRRGALLLLILIVLAGIGWFGYGYYNRQAFLSNNPLPPPPQGNAITFAGKTPANSFHVEGDNVLARTVFETDAPSNSHVQIRDYMFPPNAKSKLAALPGAAVLDVYSGEGTLSVGEQDSAGEHLAAAAVKSLPAGQSLTIDNKGAVPFVVRVYVFEAK
jgi:hypothetical protein